MTRTPKAMDREKQVMLEEIKLQPEFIRNNVRDNVDRLVKSITGVEDVENVYMVGCGDSFYAAEAARLFFMEHTGLHVEAVESLEFSRYLVNYLPANSAVIGISNSGTVTRTIESVVRAREKGAKTFAVTTRDTNDLAKAAETTLIVNSPPNIKQQPDGKLVVTPGTLTYTASLTGVFSAALAFGRRHGLISGEELEAQVQEIESIGDAIEATIENVEAPSREYAESLRNKRPRMIVLGGGPNYPTAKFNVAKMYEACRYPAHVSQLEEWAHEEYFITDEDAEVFVMAPLNSESYDRSLEQMRGANDMDAHVIAIGSAADTSLKDHADLVLGIAGNLPENLTPFVYDIPFQFVSCFLAHVWELPFFGFNNLKIREVNFRQIFKSNMRTLGEQK
jgi:glucosamine--fructose-6-phosphate aminotransferase (isomerizing)